MPQNDYYQTLGVERDADADEIRKAYRKLARKHHPDLNPGDKSAEERFKKVQEAYDILSDPKKKQMYDQYGFYSENGMPRRPGRPGRRRARVRTWASADSIFRTFSRARAGSPPAARPSAAGRSYEFSGYLQPVVRPRRTSRRSEAPRKRHRPRIRPEHRFLAGDPRHAGAPEASTARKSAPPATAPERAPAPTRFARNATAAAT